MLALLVLSAATALCLVAALGWTVVSVVVSSDGSARAGATGGRKVTAPPSSAALPINPDEAADQLAARPMPAVPESAGRPGPVSTADPGDPLVLPLSTGAGPAGVPSGFPRTPEGALAQLAAIDQAALQSGSIGGARAVIEAWALPGGPDSSTWSGVRGMADLLDGAGLPGAGSPQLVVVMTPLMGLIKGELGTDFVLPCVDFEVDVTLEQTARGAVADCQRMVWSGERWMVGPGSEPALAPSVWPGTDAAYSVGYLDLRHA